MCDIFRVFDRDERGCIDVTELHQIWDEFLRHAVSVDEVPRSLLSSNSITRLLSQPDSRYRDDAFRSIIFIML